MTTMRAKTARRTKPPQVEAATNDEAPVIEPPPSPSTDDQGGTSLIPTPELKPQDLEAMAQAEGDWGTAWALYQEALKKRQGKLFHQARSVYRAMDEWHAGPTPEEGERDWLKTCEDASAEYKSGRFLIERLGAERVMDPKLMATIWGLRQNLIEEVGVTTVAESMAVDLAVLSYYNVLRIQGWIGNLALHIEHEFFGLEGPSAKMRKQRGRVEGLAVEDSCRRFAEQLIPLLEKANKLTVRNLKAVRELKTGPLPNVTVNGAQQVNVGAVQQNVTTSAHKKRTA